jgi:RNA polymerase sigma factor (sigma-70 family)
VSHDFPETHWSQLLELRDPAHPRYAEHLELLARRYWTPVYHYARALRKVSATDAEDLTQQFFTMLLARRDLEKLSPERGSFRGFLKTSLKHFLSSADRAAAVRAPLGFPFREAEAEWQAHPDRTPEEAFDREWGRTVLLEATARLRRELEAAGRAAHADIFRRYCLEDEGASYAGLAREHGLREDDVRNILRVARQRLREILSDLLRDYLLPGQDVEEELRFILSK